MESGEVFKQIAEHKYSLEDKVKEEFLGPLEDLHDKELKEVNVSITGLPVICLCVHFF